MLNMRRGFTPLCRFRDISPSRGEIERKAAILEDENPPSGSGAVGAQQPKN